MPLIHFDPGLYGQRGDVHFGGLKLQNTTPLGSFRTRFQSIAATKLSVINPGPGKVFQKQNGRQGDSGCAGRRSGR